MDKKWIVDVIRDVISNDKELYSSIYGKQPMPYGKQPIPDDFEETILAISSLDYIDLLIKVEEVLGLEFAEKCMVKSKLKIGELVELIINNV